MTESRSTALGAIEDADMRQQCDPGQSEQLQKRGIEWRRVDWTVVIGIAALHLGCLFAPFYFSWSGVVLTVFLCWVTGGLGITLCYHRLLTHRSFKTPKWFEYFLTSLGCMAWQGGPVQWVGVHRIHHKHSDHDLDPHTPNHGFTWSHILWCMHKDSEGQRGVDAAKDLLRDPGLALLNKYFWVPQFFLAGLLFVLGQWVAPLVGLGAQGMTWLIWGVCVRAVLVYHITWFVNSASHTWGYRNFETDDRSTNLWWVALLGFGEGWHNNHHAQQRSAAHGMRWWEFDMTYRTIKLLKLVGLASNIVEPQPIPTDAKAEAEAAAAKKTESTATSSTSAAPPLPWVSRATE